MATKGDINITATMDNSGVKKSADEINDILADMGPEKYTDLYNRALKDVPGFAKMKAPQQNAALYGLLNPVQQAPQVTSHLAMINKIISQTTVETAAASGAFSGLDVILAATVTVLGAVVAVVGALVGIIGAVILGVINWGKSMYDTLANSLFPFSTFYDKMLNLQTALNNLRAAWLGVFANLLNAAMPVILNIINWLTNLLNRLSMVIAALTGAKTALIGVGVEATHAGNAAKDMVAPFDKLNVLQQDNNLMMLKQVPIDPDILAGVDKFKKLWEDTKKAAQDALAWIVSTWGQFATWFNANVWQPLIPKLGELWINIKKDMDAFYNGVFIPIWTGIAAWFAKEWNDISVIFQSIWNVIVNDTTVAMALIVGNISFWLDILNGHWKSALTDFQTMWTSLWPALIGIARSNVNVLIGIFNVLSAAFFQIVNGFASAYNMIAGLGIVPWAIKSIPTIAAPKIPYLATGAVIPPNAAFMAVLGDQSAGKNIEAPESLLRQIMREELSGQQVNINFTGSLAQLAKVLKPVLDKENVRIGNSLVKRSGQVPIS